MYSVLGRRTIALRKMHLGNVIHTYDNVHRYPPLSDLFVDFGFTKGPPLIHSIHPNTFVDRHKLVARQPIHIGDCLTFDFSTFDLQAIYPG